MRVDIKGDIIPNDYKRVYGYFQWDGTCPRDIDNAIAEANGDELNIYVASGGGSMYAGVEIYEALKSYSGSKKIHIVSHAHSAASFAPCAGRAIMSPGALMMIHKVSSGASGNSDDMQRAANTLNKHDEAVVSIYQAKTGMDREKLLNLMKNETYMTAQEALEYGFVDEIDQEALFPVAAASHILTPEQVAKIEALIPREEEAPTAKEIKIARARLNLLKLEVKR